MSTSAAQVASGSATAPVVISAGAPEMSGVQYMPPAVEQQYAPQGQDVVYVDGDGNPVDINAMQSVQGGVEYVDEAGNPCDQFGNPLQYAVDEHGNPVQYVDEFGNPVADPNAGMVYGAPPATVQTSSQPAVFNVSPEIFAKLAQGGTLTQEEMDALSGGAAPAAPAAPAADAVTSAAAATASAATAVTSAAAAAVSGGSPVAKGKSSRKSSKKKALSSKKSKSKGCC